MSGLNLTDSSDSPQGTWHFRFFGIPVRVHPWFWIVLFMMGATSETAPALIWVSVCFVSILLHEVGHVLAFGVFGERAEVVLYSFGGLAIPQLGRRLTAFADILISLAGPFAGFTFAAVIAALAFFAGAHFRLGVHMLIIPSLAAFVPWGQSANPASNANYDWNVLLNDLLYVNIYWGLVNLLPIYPLDGGHVSRSLFQAQNPAQGRSRSLVVSIAVAVAVAIVGLIGGSTYMGLMFGFLAFGSFQSWDAERKRFRPDMKLK